MESLRSSTEAKYKECQEGRVKLLTYNYEKKVHADWQLRKTPGDNYNHL